MSLFDLEHLLRRRGVAAGRPKQGGAPRPARARTTTPPVRAAAFDHGEPIELLATDDLADRATAAIRGSRLAPMPMPPAAWGDPHVTPGATMASAASVFGLPEQALAGAWTVDSFDDIAEVATPSDDASAVGDPTKIGDVRDAIDEAIGDVVDAAGGTRNEQQRLLAAARSKYQDHVAAFRDELAQETERVTAAPDGAPPVEAAPTALPIDAVAPAPAPPPVPPPPPAPGGHTHDVFDRMAQGMAYATTYALPSVALTREFREFDAMLDAPPPPPPPPTPPPPVMPARALAEAPVIADSVLEADLAALEAARGDDRAAPASEASPAPSPIHVPEHPTHGESTE